MGYWPRTAPSNLVELAVAEGATTAFPFTDTSGTAVTDSALGAKTGSTYGAGVTLAQAPPGAMIGAIDLAGSNANQRVNVNSWNNLNLGVYTDAFSIEMVAKIDGAGTVGDGTYACLFGYNASHRFLVHATNGSVTVSGGTAWTAANGTIPVSSTWFHLVLTYDYSAATRTKLYVDGSLATISDGTAQVLAGVTAFLGYYDGNNYMLNGGLAFFGVYRYPLSSTQVTAHNTMSGV